MNFFYLKKKIISRYYLDFCVFCGIYEPQSLWRHHRQYDQLEVTLSIVLLGIMLHPNKSQKILRLKIYYIFLLFKKLQVLQVLPEMPCH